MAGGTMSTFNLVWSILNSLAIFVISILGKLWSDKKVQELKSSLTKRELIHKLQYEKEFEIYQSLWKQLSILERSLKFLRPVLDNDNYSSKTKNETLEKLFNDLETFQDIVDHNKPFYDKKILSFANVVIEAAGSEMMKGKVVEAESDLAILKIEELNKAINNTDMAIRTLIHEEPEKKEPKKKGKRMIKKRKWGVLLILIGVGIPSVLFFFQDDGNINLGNPRLKTVERELTPKEVEIIGAFIAKELTEFQQNSRIKRKEDLTLDAMADRIATKYFLTEEIKSTFIKWVEDNYYKGKNWSFMTERHFYIPYKYSIGIGIILVLFGFGTLIFSSFPMEDKANSGAED